MKHPKILTVFFAVFMIATLAWAADFMSVQVREGHIRNTPAFLSPVVTTLGYGDKVSVLEQKDEWSSVSTEGGKNGWMHTTALTEKEIVLEATAEDVAAAASGKEIALAGKGFNKQIEEEFREANKDLDFSLVDDMETRAVRLTEVQSFLAAGNVEGGSNE